MTNLALIIVRYRYFSIFQAFWSLNPPSRNHATRFVALASRPSRFVARGLGQRRNYSRSRSPSFPVPSLGALQYHHHVSRPMVISIDVFILLQSHDSPLEDFYRISSRAEMVSRPVLLLPLVANQRITNIHYFQESIEHAGPRPNRLITVLIPVSMPAS